MFSLKRAYWQTQVVMRSGFAVFDLTPARFDLMARLAEAREGVRQGELSWALGVCGKTVSVMLRSLEKLGFVRRRRDVEDGRVRIVELTDEGAGRVRAAREALLGAVAAYVVQYMLKATAATVWGVAQELDAVLRRIETQMDGFSREWPWTECAAASQGEAWRRVPRLAQRLAWSDH